MNRERRARWLTAVWTLAVLLWLPPAVAGEAQQQGEIDKELPKASQILARYVEAVGGEKALRQHTSMMIKGTFQATGAGLKGDLVLYNAAPNKMLVKITVPEIGVIVQAYDGEVAWTDNPMTGPMILEGEQVDEAMLLSDFYAELNFEKNYASVETVDRTEFHGRDCYKLRLVKPSQREVFHYFDVETRLMVGNEGEQVTEYGNIFTTTYFDNYQEFGGRLLPTQTTQILMGGEQIMGFTEVVFDAVDPSVFRMPASIKALLEPPEESSEEPTGTP